MKIKLSTAECTGRKNNCLYPVHVEASTLEEFRKAVQFDHVAGLFKDDYRSNENFIESETVLLDCDNDTDDESKWITPEQFLEMIPDVCCAVVYSRNNMKEKGGKSARPRWHIYFPVSVIRDAEEYSTFKRILYYNFPFFDDCALDAARFSFGCTGDIIWHEGSMMIDKYVETKEYSPFETDSTDVISEGSRNRTMSHFAGKILKRYGISEKAHGIFLEHSLKCDPPLDDDELDSIWNSALKFYKKVASSDGYIPPDEYGDDFDDGTSLMPEDFTDLGQAKIIVREYGNELCYTEATDLLRYDGQVWNENRQQPIGAVEEFLDLQLQDARDMVEKALKKLLDLGEREEDITGASKKYVSSLSGDVLEAFKVYATAVNYRNFVLKRRDMKYVISALQAAKPMLWQKVTMLDRDPFLLNCPGITVNLRDGAQKPPDPADYITKQTLVTPGKDGMDLWLDAVNLFFCGDEELIDYVQKIVGLAAIGKVFFEALIIAYGSGRNGKSTFWNSISRVLGSYSGSLSADTLTAGCRRNVKPELAELKGKRMIIAAELEEGVRLSTSLVKQICSTDEIEAEKKYKDPFRFSPSHTVVLYTNHLPKVGTNDAGIWRRLIVIPFNAVIEGSADIKNYTDFLVNNAGGAILSWIIEGAEKVIESEYRLDMPRCVRNAVDAYRENNDWLGHFLEECCDIGDSFSEKSGDLYSEYRNFCSRTNEYTRSTTDFYSALSTMGFEKKRTKTNNMILGLRLKIEDFQ